MLGSDVRNLSWGIEIPNFRIEINGKAKPKAFTTENTEKASQAVARHRPQFQPSAAARLEEQEAAHDAEPVR